MCMNNSISIKKLRLEGYEGKCVGLANGRVVAADKSAGVVMKKLSGYKGQKISLITIPKKNKVLVL